MPSSVPARHLVAEGRHHPVSIGGKTKEFDEHARFAKGETRTRRVDDRYMLAKGMFDTLILKIYLLIANTVIF